MQRGLRTIVRSRSEAGCLEEAVPAEIVRSCPWGKKRAENIMERNLGSSFNI